MQQQGCRGQSREIPAWRISADQHSPAWEACLLTSRGGRGLGAEAWASEVRSQGEDWGWLREHSLKGASAPQLARRESGKKTGPAEEARDNCFGVRKERGFRAPPKRAPEMGASHGYQRVPQRRAWDAKAAAASKKPVSKHRSPSTPPLLGASAARHCQGPMIQGQLHQENTRPASGCCNVTPASAAAGLPCIRTPPFPRPEWARAPTSGAPLTPSCLGQKGRPQVTYTQRQGQIQSWTQELCEQRREREISPGSLRSSGLNLHNQLNVPCMCGIRE